MADNSLLSTVKAGGSQLQMSNQDVSSLAKAAGSPINPTQPLGAATIGANPDQSKMAGTPNSLANAVKQMRVSPTGKSDLATAVRTAQQQQTQTAEQAALAQQAQQLGGLGSLMSRVPQLIQQDYAKAASTAGPANLQVNTSAISQYGIQGQDATDMQTALRTLGSATASDADKTAAIVRAGNIYNKATGATGAPDAATLQHLFMEPGQDQGAALAAAVQDKLPQNLTVGELLNNAGPTALGMSSQELDQLLGVQPGAAAKMTIQQLTSAIQAKQSGQYNTEAQWRSILADPTSSRNLRETATTMLKGMGATGMDTVEKSVQKLTQQVQSANTVNFFGQSMTVGDALSSDVVKGTINSILTDPTFAAKAAQQSPEFTKWVQDNAQELSTAYSTGLGNLDKSVVSATTDYQAQWANLDPATQQALGYDPHQVVDPSNPPQVPAIVAGMAKLGKADQLTVSGVLSQVSQAAAGGPGAPAAQAALDTIKSVDPKVILQQGPSFNEALTTALHTSSGSLSDSDYVTAATGNLSPGESAMVGQAAAAQALGLGVTLDPALQAMAAGDPKAKAAAIAKLSPSLDRITSTLKSGGVVGPSFAEQLSGAASDFAGATKGLSPAKTAIMEAMGANISAGKGATLTPSQISDLTSQATAAGAGGDLSFFNDLALAWKTAGASNAQLQTLDNAKQAAVQASVTKMLAKVNFSGSGDDFTAAVNANTDLGKAADYVANAQNALYAAQSVGADSLIINDLKARLGSAQNQYAMLNKQETDRQGASKGDVNAMAKGSDSPVGRVVAGGTNGAANQLSTVISGNQAGSKKKGREGME